MKNRQWLLARVRERSRPVTSISSRVTRHRRHGEGEVRVYCSNID